MRSSTLDHVVTYSNMYCDLIICVIDIALAVPQVHRLGLDPLVTTDLRVPAVIRVTELMPPWSWTVAAVRDVHMHRVQLLDRRVDIVPKGGSRSCNKMFHSVTYHCSVPANILCSSRG